MPDFNLFTLRCTYFNKLKFKYIFSELIDAENLVSSLKMKISELDEKKEQKIRDFYTKKSYLFLSSIFEEIKELEKLISKTYIKLGYAQIKRLNLNAKMKILKAH